VQANTADTSATSSLWLIEHERDDPMVLTQHELPREDAQATLTRLLKAHVANGLHVDPPFSHLEIGPRYDVHDANGWFATYWLSEEKLARDEGMLTAIVGPGAKQRAHVVHPSKNH
jgi:hypothetical protein